MSGADAPIRYIERTRAYYGALGYPPYRWAQHDTTPFAPLAKPLDCCRVALVTTAAPFRPECGDQGPGAAYNAAAKFYAVYSGDAATDPDLRISHVAYDRDHTRADDPNTWLPLAALRRAVAARLIAGVTPRFHGLPTNRSQRHTIETDCPELLQRCREDGADAVLLVPNCPVCHQSCTLAARALESAGLPAVVMGCALDIVEACGAPRFLWSDFPLGNSAGLPNDPASQDETVRLALGLLASATGPNTTFRSPLRWPEDSSWKADYCNVARLSAAELAQRQMAFAQQKEVARRLRR